MCSRPAWGPASLGFEPACEAYPYGSGCGVYPEGYGVAVEVCARNGGGAHQPLHAAQLARTATAPVVLRERVGLPVELLGARYTPYYSLLTTGCLLLYLLLYLRERVGLPVEELLCRVVVRVVLLRLEAHLVVRTASRASRAK